MTNVLGGNPKHGCHMLLGAYLIRFKASLSRSNSCGALLPAIGPSLSVASRTLSCNARAFSNAVETPLSAASSMVAFMDQLRAAHPVVSDGGKEPLDAKARGWLQVKGEYTCCVTAHRSVVCVVQIICCHSPYEANSAGCTVAHVTQTRVSRHCQHSPLPAGNQVGLTISQATFLL